MDVISRAQTMREWHLEQARKFETFLATYYDLEQELKSGPPAEVKSDAEKAEAPKRQRTATRPQSGIGAETIAAAEHVIANEGPMSTRDLLPHIMARGIEVGGRDPVATLSARLSGRGDLITYNGKWYFEKDLPPLVRMARHGVAQKEEADNPAKDTSASSVSHSNQGGDHAPALV